MLLRPQPKCNTQWLCTPVATGRLALPAVSDVRPTRRVSSRASAAVSVWHSFVHGFSEVRVWNTPETPR